MIVRFVDGGMLNMDHVVGFYIKENSDGLWGFSVTIHGASSPLAGYHYKTKEEVQEITKRITRAYLKGALAIDLTEKDN